MQRRLLFCFSLLLFAYALPLRTAHALPPNGQFDLWNEGPAPTRNPGESDADFKTRKDAWLLKRQNRKTWNCYNYGVDVQTTAAGKAVRAHPGKGIAWPGIGNNITSDSMCTKARKRAILDGLHAVAWTVGDTIPAPPTGENLVALGSLAGKKGDGADYHWWRLNKDKSWTHKRGGTLAKGTYTDGTGAEKPLTDPRDAAQRDGYSLCGFMSVPKAAVPNVGSLSAAPVCSPSQGTVLVQSESQSGFPDPQKVLTPTEVLALESHLPTFSPGNRTVDPAWIPLPAGQYQGWEVITDVNGYGPVPPDMRVYLGIIEVARAWPDTEGVEFYTDDNGLEAYLDQALFTQPTDFCTGTESTTPITACECSDEALGGTVTPTLLSLFQALPVGDGLELRWRFSDPSRFANTTLERALGSLGPWKDIDADLSSDAGVSVAVDRDVVAGRTYYYRLVGSTAGGQQIIFGPIAALAGTAVGELALGRVRPNPSHGLSTVTFTLPRASDVRLTVVDIQGRQIASLADGLRPAGSYDASWDGRTARGVAAAAGRYFVRLEVGDRTLVQPLVLTR